MRNTTSTPKTPTRLDKLLAERDDVGSRRRAREAIQTGKVTVNGEVCREAGHIVEPGDVADIAWNAPGTAKQRVKGLKGLSDSKLHILYEDEALLAVNKPPHMLTDTASLEQHRTRDSVYKRLRTYLKASDLRPRTVHRIDRDTSGVVLFAKTDAAEFGLREQFQNYSTERIYRALVHAGVDQVEETWDDWTRWNKRAHILGIVPEEAPGARRTLCYPRVVERLSEAALELEIRLHTGRRNQIRLQAAIRDLPLIGERLYGEPPKSPNATRQMLHAYRLVVNHPTHRKLISFEAPVPRDYARSRRSLRQVH